MFYTKIKKLFVSLSIVKANFSKKDEDKTFYDTKHANSRQFSMWCKCYNSHIG